MRDRRLRGGLVGPGLQRAHLAPRPRVGEPLAFRQDAALVPCQSPQPVRLRVVQVHHQLAAGNQVPPDRRQAGGLIRRGQQILERMARDDGQAKDLAQVKGPHIALHPAGIVQPGALFPCHIEHSLRKVESHHLEPLSRQPDGHPPRAAGHLQHGLALGMSLRSQLQVESDLARPVGHRGLVRLGIEFSGSFRSEFAHTTSRPLGFPEPEASMDIIPRLVREDNLLAQETAQRFPACRNAR